MPAERRIAELAASGHRNPEITATLYISVKTVEANLTQIYANSRHEAESTWLGTASPYPTHRASRPGQDLHTLPASMGPIAWQAADAQNRLLCIRPAAERRGRLAARNRRYAWF